MSSLESKLPAKHVGRRSKELAFFVLVGLNGSLACGHLGLDLSNEEAALDLDDSLLGSESGGTDSGTVAGSGGDGSGGDGSGGDGSGGDGSGGDGSGGDGSGGDGSGGDGSGGDGSGGDGSGGDGSGGDGSGGDGSGGDGSGGGTNFPEVTPLPSTCSTGDFTDFTRLANLEISGDKKWPSLTSNGLILFFSMGDRAGEKIYQAKRSSRSAVFGAASEVTSINTHQYQTAPHLNSDATRLYFTVQNASDPMSGDLWFAWRESAEADFGEAQKIEAFQTTDHEGGPWLSWDELSIYFMKSSATGSSAVELWKATREDLNQPFGESTELTTLRGGTEDSTPALSPDGLTLYMSSDRANPNGQSETGKPFNIWQATRTSLEDEFSAPEIAYTYSSEGNDRYVSLSADGRDLIFSSSRGGGALDLYMVSRSCF